MVDAATVRRNPSVRTGLRGTTSPTPSPDAVGPELGKSGLKRFGGFLSEEFLAELRGQQGVRVYNEMRNNEPNIGGMLAAIEAVILSVEWNAVPKTDSPLDVAAADFLNIARTKMDISWEEFLSDVCTMFPFGWALFEDVFKYEDGKIWWRTLALRSQDSLFEWEFDEKNHATTFVQMPPPDFHPIKIPMSKCTLFRTKTEKDNPEGYSILRTAYKPYYYKRVIEEIEAMGAERDLIGIPVMHAPFGATKKELAEAKTIVAAIKNDEQAGIVLPAIGPEQWQKWEFALVSGQGSAGRVSWTDRLVQRYSNEMMMTALAQFLRLGQTGFGSYALSSDQRDIFQIAIRGWMARIRETINRGPVRKLLRINGMVGQAHYEHGPVGNINLQTMANFLAAGVQNGFITTTRELEDFLRKHAELPPLKDSDKTSTEKAEEQAAAQEAAAAAQAEAAAMAAAQPQETQVIAATKEEIAAAESLEKKKANTQGITSNPGANQSMGVGSSNQLAPQPMNKSVAFNEDAFAELKLMELMQFHGDHDQKTHGRGGGGASSAGGGGKSPESLAESMFVRAKESEGQISGEIVAIVKAHGGEMAGLQHAIKQPSSLARKIKADAIEKGISHEEAAAQIGDSLRYTAVFPEGKYVEGTKALVQALESQGYERYKFKNMWVDDDLTYQGINSNFRTPDGLQMEMQMHTSTSHAMKEQSHVPYEVARSLTATPVQKASAIKTMIKQWSAVALPVGVATLTFGT